VLEDSNGVNHRIQLRQSHGFSHTHQTPCTRKITGKCAPFPSCPFPELWCMSHPALICTLSSKCFLPGTHMRISGKSPRSRSSTSLVSKAIRNRLARRLVLEVVVALSTTMPWPIRLTTTMLP
jgi:hypothetical protein